MWNEQFEIKNYIITVAFSKFTSCIESLCCISLPTRQRSHHQKSITYWHIHISKLAYNFKIVWPWLIHFSKLAYDFKMAHSYFKTCLQFQDNWDNDWIATSFKIHFCYKKIYVSSASWHHTKQQVDPVGDNITLVF